MAATEELHGSTREYSLQLSTCCIDETATGDIASKVSHACWAGEINGPIFSGVSQRISNEDFRLDRSRFAFVDVAVWTVHLSLYE